MPTRRTSKKRTSKRRTSKRLRPRPTPRQGFTEVIELLNKAWDTLNLIDFDNQRIGPDVDKAEQAIETAIANVKNARR